MSLPLFLGKFEPNLYLEWKKEVEELFYIYDLMENEKVPPILESFTPFATNIWETTKESRRKQGKKPVTTWKELKETIRLDYGVKYLETLERMKEKEQTKKPSIVEESSRVIELHKLKLKLKEV